MSKVSFELEGKEYHLPDYITIEKYIEVFKIKDILIDEYKAVKILSILSGAKVDDLFEVNYQEIENLMNYVYSLFPNNNKFYDKFKYDGVEYGFLPEWKNMSFAEFVDIDTLFSMEGVELYNNIPKITAIMYRPITKNGKKGRYEIEKYDIDSMLERAEIFKNVDVKYFISAQFFFMMFTRNYNNPTQQYLKKMKFWKRVKMISLYFRLKWTLKKGSDGTQLLKEFQNTISQNTMK